jgi:hypothetical protein
MKSGKIKIEQVPLEELKKTLNLPAAKDGHNPNHNDGRTAAKKRKVTASRDSTTKSRR